MNYFEYHLGDYAKQAGHLTLLEHGVFGRLRDVYLSNEAPIPDAKAERLVMARLPEECAAVRTVLSEFFELRDGAWHRGELDELISSFQAGEPQRAAVKANGTARVHRHREKRARLAEVAAAAGLSVPWNIKTADLQALVDGLSNHPQKPATPETFQALPETVASVTGVSGDEGSEVSNGSATPLNRPRDVEFAKTPASATAPATPETFQATAPVTPATATQYPVPNTHMNSSVPYGTEADASLAAESKTEDRSVPSQPPSTPSPPTPKSVEEMAKAEVWRAAVSVLAQGGCEDEAQARSFMGKLVRDYTFPVVKDAVAAAVTNQPAEAREYLRATCQRLKGGRPPADGSASPPGYASLDAYMAAEAARTIAKPTPEQIASLRAAARSGLESPKPKALEAA